MLTTCGYFGRVLTVGSQYLVGIGGPCSHFYSWSEISRYTESDLAYLQTLRDPVMCSSITISSAPSASVSSAPVSSTPGTPSFIISAGAIAGIVAGIIGAVMLVAVVIIIGLSYCLYKNKKTPHKAADGSKYAKHSTSDDDDELII